MPELHKQSRQGRRQWGISHGPPFHRTLGTGLCFAERTRFPPRARAGLYIEPFSHMMTHIMKTTLDLPDHLLIAAKALAAQRKTTLKAMVEHALRREIAPQENLSADSPYELGPFGILSLKKRTQTLTADQVQRLIHHQHDEEDARIIAISSGNA